MFKRYLKLSQKADDGAGGGGGQGAAAQGGDDGAAAAPAKGGDDGKGGGDAGALAARRAANKANGQGDDAGAAAGKGAAAGADGRPADIPEQFWDPEKKAVRHESLAKAWKDTAAENKTLKATKGAPPEKAELYVFDRPATLPAHILADPAKDESLKLLRETAHAAGLTQEQFGKLAAGYYERAAKLLPAPPDPKAEIAKLGENGEKVADAVISWVEGLGKTGLLNDAEVDALVMQGASADGIRGLNKIREALGGGAPIPVGALEGATSHTADELYAMVGTEKYKKDPAERARVDKLFEQHFGTAPAGTSLPGVGVNR